MLDNEDRADFGELAIRAAAQRTGVDRADVAETALIDVLAYVRHFADRLGLDAEEVWTSSRISYEGDFDDGPRAEIKLDPEVPLVPGSTQLE